jgi:putative oxidoreductase
VAAEETAMNTRTSTTDRPQASKALHFSLWGVQILLALAFTSGGVVKSTQPIAELAAKLVWPGAMPEALVRFIGVSELLGGLGLILPAATRIKPVLTPLAGVGLAIIMLFAAIFHVVRGEFGALPINFALGALAAFVAWGRWKKAPIAPR